MAVTDCFVADTIFLVVKHQGHSSYLLHQHDIMMLGE